MCCERALTIAYARQGGAFDERVEVVQVWQIGELMSTTSVCIQQSENHRGHLSSASDMCGSRTAAGEGRVVHSVVIASRDLSPGMCGV